MEKELTGRRLRTDRIHKAYKTGNLSQAVWSTFWNGLLFSAAFGRDVESIRVNPTAVQLADIYQVCAKKFGSPFYRSGGVRRPILIDFQSFRHMRIGEFTIPAPVVQAHSSFADSQGRTRAPTAMRR